MASTRGRCTNFDYCSVAESRRDLQVPLGQDFVCPECGKPLKAPDAAGAKSGSRLPLIIGGGVVAVVGVGVFLGMQLAGSKSSPAPAPAPAPVAAAPAPAPAQPAPTQQAASAAPAPAAAPAAAQDVVLARLRGSPLVASAIGPKLAAAYLSQIGDTDIATAPGSAPGETKVTGLRAGRPESIVITGSTTEDGFAALGAGTADIVMASRRVSALEHDTLASAGDMSSPQAEHVLALDGLAVVVNPASRIEKLTREQVKSIFSGGIVDWSEVGGAEGPIHLYAPASNRELNRVMIATVLGNAALMGNTRRSADAAIVAQGVAADPSGIGLVDLANIGAARPVSISETGAAAVAPTNRLAVATEEYPFSFRLFLYTAPAKANAFAQRFVEYALSPAGQAVAEQSGVVSQNVKAEAAAVPATASAKFKALLSGARRLGIDFRFQPNSTDLDLKGTRDVDRVWNYFLSSHLPSSKMILVGFADNQGDPAANIAVSRKRADAVAGIFAARGFAPGKVAGFGSELPVADNSTEEGRERNRRVEVYIAQ